MTATATLPPLHAPHTGGDPDVALVELRAVIEHSIAHQPRTLQTEIGPSELGGCEHCLAARLAGMVENETGVAWLPFVGTAVHAALAEFVIAHENDRGAQHTTGLRYLSEQEVTVGVIAGQPISGHLDLFDTHTGIVVDFKIVGATTLRAAKSGPTDQYRTQVHLYGKGMANAGHQVDHVAIAYLPRNAVTLGAAIWWHEPYDETVAIDALERANRLHTNIAVLRDALGDPAVAAWVANLPRDPHCFSCARYPDAPASPSPLADLIG